MVIKYERFILLAVIFVLWGCSYKKATIIKPLCTFSDFELKASWYGGNTSTGEVYTQYHNLIVATPISNYDTLLSIAQWYRTNQEGLGHSIINFYHPGSHVPNSQGEFNRILSDEKSKNLPFAHYEYNAHPLQENLTIF